jgi:hypothetical protein
MQVPQPVSSALNAVDQTLDAITRFAKLERVLAVICVMTPFLLVLYDDGAEPIRASISHYFNMKQNQLYYFPLTMLAMLFIVNGAVKDKSRYNTLLGTVLAGVILFNREAFPITHKVFAVLFFGGNGAVILLFSSKKELWFKAMLVGVIAITMIAWRLEWISLFWAEWISFAVIALHYILESLGRID